MVNACAVVEAVEAEEPVLPAQIKIFQLERTIDQCLFQIELLQIDESGHLVPLLRQQIERIEQFVADKDLAELPGDALRPSRSPTPSRSRISSVRFDQQMPREPSPIRSASSISTTGTPRCARSIAAARPTGPAPTTTTGRRTTAAAS